MKKTVLLLSVLYIVFCSAAAYSEIVNEDLLSDYDDALRCLEEYNPCLPVIRQQYPDYDVLGEEYRNMVRTNGKTPKDSIPFAQSSPLALGARSMLVSRQQTRLFSGFAGQRTALTFGSFATAVGSLLPRQNEKHPARGCFHSGGAGGIRIHIFIIFGCFCVMYRIHLSLFALCFYTAPLTAQSSPAAVLYNAGCFLCNIRRHTNLS